MLYVSYIHCSTYCVPLYLHIICTIPNKVLSVRPSVRPPTLTLIQVMLILWHVGGEVHMRALVHYEGVLVRIGVAPCNKQWQCYCGFQNATQLVILWYTHLNVQLFAHDLLSDCSQCFYQILSPRCSKWRMIQEWKRLNI